MKPTLHIIARNLTKNEAKQINGMRDSFIFWHFNTPKVGLSNREYKQQLKPEDKKKINYRVIQQILQFSNESVDNTNISSLLEYEKMNFWFYQRLTVYMAARNLEYLLEEIRLAAGSYSIIIYTDFPVNTVSHLLPEEVQYQYSPSGNTDVIKGIVIGLSMILAFLKVVSKSSKLIAGKHLILDNAKPQTIHIPAYREGIKGNFILNNLFSEIDNRFCLIRETGLPGKRGAGISEYSSSVQYKILDLNFISSDLILLRTFSRHSSRKKIQLIIKDLRDKLRLLNDRFAGTEYSILTYLLSGLESSYRVYITRYIGFKGLCSKHQPLSLTAADENSPYNKCLLDAAKSMGIKTYGVQHGAIHELHPAYRFTEYESEKGFTPDITFTWGEYWRDILIKTGNYKASKIIITGQLRTDTISVLKSSIRDKRKESKIILFASQPQRDPTLRRKAAADLFGAASQVDNLKIWLKPHPLERDYKEYYGSIADEMNTVGVEFFEDRDLYELIFASDAVFTCFSTVGAEAVYFSKPLIIHDPLNQDIQGYIAAGVGIQVKDQSECIKVLRGIADSTLIQDDARVLEFIEKYAFKIDGEVAKRVISSIIAGS